VRFDGDDARLVVGVLVVSLAVVWASAVLGLALRVFFLAWQG
jgi:hypothetical protein